ncbi:hypothetical protein A4A49_53799 [Nicotiana attenuata]|uniref:Uncharacterized protein n=1 Tax=Nicotiana attenuata TaxID=49451 RepID=A0A1J6IKA0_NICAT|nr:hypothetical protein A4A49_53799 [Nicotiana attenuata]
MLGHGALFQECDSSKLLQKILDQVTGSKQEPREAGKDGIAEEVRRNPYGKKLFRKKVSGEGTCPVDLSDVSQEIAEKCQGLPLVVVLIAGVIAKKEKKKISWLEILENTNPFVFRNEVKMMKVMQLSYDHLAVDIWLAEGFVENAGMKMFDSKVV